MSIKLLALDLERTLISDALHREPRPGLFEFLRFCCRRFGRVALFTSVRKEHALAVIRQLSAEGCIPPEFTERVEYVEWHGMYKDLAFILDSEPPEVLLIDDDAGYVKPGQEGQWIAIREYDPHLVVGEDQEFARIQRLLEERLRAE